MNLQTIVVALPIEETHLRAFYDWGKSHDFSHVASVHFLHVVRITVTPLEFGLMEAPDEATFQEMRPTLLRFLQEEARKILPAEFEGSANFQVSHGFHPEEEVMRIAKDLGASLLVVSPRIKHGIEGLFQHSFTAFAIRHAPCDVLVLRPLEIRKSA